MSLTSSKADGWPGGFVTLKALFCLGGLGASSFGTGDIFIIQIPFEVSLRKP